ncbi:MAG: prephenate dehydrogenase/arogenate dehydrogenase family protein [Desulfuromonadales bacterium]|nr:prephenate dehydrogenase/arogenate dehydrogenase family protein [Desulfuromonadales bacterium]
MNKEFLIPKMCVIGVGLIGGSLALAMKEAGLVGEVVGVGRGAANLKTALRLGIIDSYTTDPSAGVVGADLVFLATPVLALGALVRTIATSLKPGAVVTDGGSVKQAVIDAVEPALPTGVCFVPGHPIAGTENSGAEAAFSTLYRDRRCILTPTENTDPGALQLVTRIWEAVGSEVVLMGVEKHDRILAAISHLPHMVAYALVVAGSSYDRYEENVLEYSAGGFKDFTRIASSDPTMWRDIALTNREALVEMITHFELFLTELKTDIQVGDAEKLFNFFLTAKQNRDAIL